MRPTFPVSVRRARKVLQSVAVDRIEDEYLIRARELHRRVVVIDAHCDTTLRLMVDGWDFAERHDDGHVDLPRLREGGVGAVFLAVFTPGPVEPGAGVAASRARMARIHETIRRHSTSLAHARSAAEVRRVWGEGRVAVLIGIEGGYLIEDSLDVLREYHGRGAMYLTLTHAFHTSWADSSGIHKALVPRHGGLTVYGREVVRELNRLGMMVDVSHAGDDTFWDVMETSSAPVVATHSSCRAVSQHCRNLSDEMMRAIAESGGVVQINFCPAFIDPEYPPIDTEAAERWWAEGATGKAPVPDHVTPLGVLVDHFDHALQLIGPDHVGIGSDFDGVAALPSGMEDCSKLPNLTCELLRRGYTEADVTKVLGENVLRVMEGCRRCSEELQGADRSAECGRFSSDP